MIGFRFVRSCCPALPASVGLWLMIAMFTAVVPTIAAAQSQDGLQPIATPSLDIEAVIGWDGIADRSTPIPIALLISNFSNAPVEGEVWIKDPWQGKEIFLGDVYISEGTSRRLNSIQALPEWSECVVELRSGNKTLWRQRSLSMNMAQQFDGNVKYALIVNNSTRHLDLPSEVTVQFVARTPNTRRRYTYYSQSYSDETATISNSQAVKSLNCKTWQLPTHAAALMPMDAVVFPDDVKTDDLNAAQWQALSEWMCRGGTVFVHGKSSDIIQQLLTSSPLNYEPSALLGRFPTTRVGLGSIREFADPLFAEGSQEQEQQIADAIATQDTRSLPKMIQLSKTYNRESGRADRTRTWIMAFFGIYTLMSGGVTLLLFRRSRRSVTYYIVSVVLIGCVASGILGASLRYSRGDVHWVSVTQAGVGGAIQYAKLDLQSAGGRNTVMGVTGPNVDLQQIATSNNYYYVASSSDRFPPFSRQPSLSPTNDDSFQIRVPITPWGRQELHATSFNSELSKLDVKLKFMGSIKTQQKPQLEGQFELEIANKLPFDLVNARIYIGRAWKNLFTDPATALEINGPISSDALAMVDERYFMTTLRTLEAGTTFRNRFTIRDNQPTAVLDNVNNRGSLAVPPVSKTGVINAWIIGQIPKSPGLAIDDANSDFSSAEEMHFYVQQILPEEMN